MKLSSKGTKVDMIKRMQEASITKAVFDNAYAKIYSHSGGWLSAVCQHNVVYGLKFESPGS